MKYMMTASLLIAEVWVLAMDPPVMEWEMQYYPSLASLFRDVHQMPDGNLILGGCVWSGPKEAFLISMDLNGDTLWTCGNEWYSQYAYGAEELDDGQYIVTGSCMELSTSSGELFIAKTDSAGSVLWEKIYDVSGSNEIGYCVTALPEGRFAVSGRVNSTSSQNGQAWILCMDSDGDTLWSDIWGDHTLNFAPSVLVQDGKLVVLVYGSASGELPLGPHLLLGQKTETIWTSTI